VIEETISVGQCVLIWLATVSAALVVVEGALFAVYKYPDREKSLLRYAEPHRKNLVAKIPYVAIELGRILGHFLLGALATLLTTEMAKYKVGRLRPYFLTLCGVRLTKGKHDGPLNLTIPTRGYRFSRRALRGPGRVSALRNGLRVFRYL
jgi:hypothetical protein